MSKQAILKWGNSLGFRLPSEVAKQMKVSEGSEVTYTLDGSRLIIEPVAEELPPFEKVKPVPLPCPAIRSIREGIFAICSRRSARSISRRSWPCSRSSLPSACWSS